MSQQPLSSLPRRGLASTLWSAFTSALYLAWTALVVVAPVAAAWVASSLAAHSGGSIRAAAASGLLVFPLLPVAWEAVSSWRRARKAKTAKRFLTLTDRMVLRTLAVSLTFLGALMARDPQRVFVALNARGDWMLDGHHEARAESARRAVFWLASKSEWLYRLTDDNPFHEDSRSRPRPQPVVDRVVARTETDTNPTPSPTPTPTPTPPVTDTTPTPPVADTTPTPPVADSHAWPWRGELHAAVREMTPEVETSPRAVGLYLASRESDPWKLARAVHDYVADRVAYDVDSYRSGVYPPQDADTTFRSRKSVCAGYAALFEAVGRAAGLEVETVVGRARGMVATGMGEGHAWSAVKLGGRWHLIDTTWDAGYVSADGFHKRYGTMYFLTPPEAFVTRHFPDEPRWQLLDAPRSPGEFMRAPALDPEFFAYGLHLVSPDRAESDARGAVEVVIDNPRRIALMVDVGVSGDRQGTRCTVSEEARVTARCPLNGADLHEVMILASPQRYGTYWSVGSLRVHNR
ncbi:MAG: transglutaminase domain-containing protein [Polyangiales bacterium]